MRRHRELTALTLPEGTLDLVRDIPAADLRLLATATNLVAREDLHPEVVGLLLQAAREIHRPASLLAEEGTFPSTGYTSLPLSSSAATYLADGRGLIYRLLPFWMAGLVTWLVEMLTPAATVAVFVYKILPDWRGFRFNLRRRRFFKRLVRLEKAARRGGAGRRGPARPGQARQRQRRPQGAPGNGESLLRVPPGHPRHARPAEGLMPRRTAALLLGLWLVAAGPAVASHPKTDIVTLDKGDRFYGEIKKVTQGTLTLKTASAGTLSVKWSHVVRLVSTFQFQVQLTNGERYYGSLAEPDQEGQLKVVGSGGTHSLPLTEVFWVGPVERGFWRKLTGSVDFGFSYTQSNQAVQYSLAADSQYLGRKIGGDLQLNSIFNTQEDAESASNQSLTLTLWRALNAVGGKANLFGLGQVQSNPNQGFDLRSIAGGGAGLFLRQMSGGFTLLSAGVAVDREQVTGSTDVTTDAQLLLGLRYSRYRTDFPKHSFNLIANTFTYLTESSRFRAQISFKVSFEIIHNLNVSLNILDSYDSRPSTDERGQERPDASPARSATPSERSERVVSLCEYV